LFAALCTDVAADLDRRLVVPDRPGYGRSTAPPRGWSWDDWRTDLFELLDAEGIEQAPLVGFSGGGPFALAAATPDRTPRIALVSSVIPPARNWLTLLSRVPFALRLLFRGSKPLARLRGPEAIVGQYTDRPVSEATATAVVEEFHEALRQGATAVERETRLFATESINPLPTTIPVRAWHGQRDTNAPAQPVRSFLDDTGTVVSAESDHLGTLLDRQRDVFEWVAG
jgi:pimeloyl-ACP methyl ester carboxylesterase